MRFSVGLGTTTNRMFASEPFRPVLVLGPQRSYKTTGVAIPTLLEWNGPALVTSVRRDVLDGTFNWRRRQGKTYIYDPSTGLDGTPFASERYGWDILAECTTWDDSVRTARALTEAGRLHGVLDEAFWYSLATQSLAPYLFAARHSGRTMDDVVRWTKTQDEFEVRSILQDARNELAIMTAEDGWQREDRVRSSVYATLSSVLRVFDYEQTGALAGPYIDIDEFLQSENDTIYVCGAPDEQDEYRPLFTGLVRTVVRRLYSKNIAELDNLPVHGSGSNTSVGRRQLASMLLLLDEAGNIAALENLDGLATTAAGTRLQIVSIFHDVSQMEHIYGQYGARSILNNHSALLVLPGSRDRATLEYIEMLLRGERVANALESNWIGPRPIRSMQKGEALLVYENLRPIVLSLRSTFNNARLRDGATDVPVGAGA